MNEIIRCPNCGSMIKRLCEYKTELCNYPIKTVIDSLNSYLSKEKAIKLGTITKNDYIHYIAEVTTKLTERELKEFVSHLAITAYDPVPDVTVKLKVIRGN